MKPINRGRDNLAVPILKDEADAAAAATIDSLLHITNRAANHDPNPPPDQNEPTPAPRPKPRGLISKPSPLT